MVTASEVARRSLSTSNTTRYTIYEHSAQRMNGLNKQPANTGGNTEMAAVWSGRSFLKRCNAHPGHVTAHPSSSLSAGMQQEQGSVGPGVGGHHSYW